jgi:hypothetical protein
MLARGVADAVLYEGYLLYPYRRSSAKNQVRWQFGVLAPREWVESVGADNDVVAGAADAWYQQTECLLEAPDAATLHVRLRFLQLRHRSIEVRGPDGGYRAVDELDIDGRRHLSFDEAVPREFDLEVRIGALRQGHSVDVTVPGAEDVEPIGEDHAARVVYRCWPVSARVRLSVEVAATPFRLLCVRVRIENTATSVPAGTARPQVLRSSLLATHALLGVRGGSFLSLLDPPAWAAEAAKACHTVHTFPVLCGAENDREVMLSSPILMYDHPQVSPESPADLFDATEIDEILSLRTLTLTDEEKGEARATDPRAADILDRVEDMPREVLERLHGAVRTLRPISSADHRQATAADSPDDPELATPPDDAPRATARWWEPGAEQSLCPARDAVLVDGVPVRKGSRVRLRPRTGGGDAHDMFLAGRTARVQAVLLDTEDARHVAVTLDDDPGADLHQWYGRFYYFAPEELQPLNDGRAPET